MRRGGWLSVPFFLAAWGAGGCIPAAEMHPGQGCGSCHDGDRAPAFGVAGTVYADPAAGARDGVEGVTIDVTSADGHRVSLHSNGVGNFFTTERLQAPLQVAVFRGAARSVMADAPSGDCNSCHGAGGQGPGRLYLH